MTQTGIFLFEFFVGIENWKRGINGQFPKREENPKTNPIQVDSLKLLISTVPDCRDAPRGLVLAVTHASKEYKIRLPSTW